MRIGAIRALLYAPRDRARGRKEPSINEIRVSQHPSDTSQDDMLLVSWEGGKLTTGGRPEGLTDEQWDDLTLLDWTEEQKRSYLLDIWERAAALPTRLPAPAAEKQTA